MHTAIPPPAVLIAAYDDTAGVTAAFNKNVFAMLNASLGVGEDVRTEVSAKFRRPGWNAS